MAERMLAHVEQIVNIQPINGADFIEYVTVLGWHVIQAKNTVKVNDKVVYIEIDSRVPAENVAFEFLAKRDYKVKSMKMRGVISQGLIMTFDSLGLDAEKYEIGQDMTKELGIVKIETQEEKDLKKAEQNNFDAAFTSMKARHKQFFAKSWIKKLMKYKLFRKFIFKIWGKKKDKPRDYPAFITKTDEIRVENMPWILGDKEPFIATEKINGTSTTFALKKLKKDKYEFIVCSRNVRQADVNQETFHDDTNSVNVYWEMAFKYEIEARMKELFNLIPTEIDPATCNVVILQGETLGKVQGNPYKLNENQFYGYNICFTNDKKDFYYRVNPYQGRTYTDYISATVKPSTVKINWVPILGNVILPDTIEEIKEQAEGKSKINANVDREGIVYRKGQNEVISFKNVSNTYLLKHQN